MTFHFDNFIDKLGSSQTTDVNFIAQTFQLLIHHSQYTMPPNRNRLNSTIVNDIQKLWGFVAVIIVVFGTISLHKQKISEAVLLSVFLLLFLLFVLSLFFVILKTESDDDLVTSVFTNSFRNRRFRRVKKEFHTCTNLAFDKTEKYASNGTTIELPGKLPVVSS